jgi:hypothetical protein
VHFTTLHFTTQKEKEKSYWALLQARSRYGDLNKPGRLLSD